MYSLRRARTWESMAQDTAIHVQSCAIDGHLLLLVSTVVFDQHAVNNGIVLDYTP